MLFLLWNLVASVALEFVDFDCDVIIIVFFFWLAVFCYGGWRGAAAAVGWLYAIFVLILGMLWPILRSLLLVYGAIMWGTMAITFGIIVTCQNCCGMIYHKNRSRILDKYDQHKKRSHSNKDDSSGCDDAELYTSGKRKKLVTTTNDRQRSAVKEVKSSSSRQRFDEFDEMIEMDSLSAIKRKGKIRSLADDSATKRRASGGRKSSSSSKSNADDWFGNMKKEVMKFYNMMKKHDLVP